VRAHGAGVRTGILAPTPELVDRYRRAGVSLLVTGTDLAMLAAGARAVIAALAPRGPSPVTSRSTGSP
jgi:2-keto-3-deoxy-L-rhamnonate aldolase RhmA